MISGRRILSALVLGCALLPALSQAQDKKQAREQAKVLEAQMRAQGEPRDRCSLGVNIHEGLTVVRINKSTPLKHGDRLVLLNQVSLAGKTPEEFITRLRAITPDEIVELTVDRNGQLIDLKVPCVNARLTYEPMINALNLASRGKFDECVSAIAKIDEPDSRSEAIKVQCASVSRNAKKYDVPAMTARVLEMAIDDARYAPAMRVEVVKQLRSSEGIITQGLGVARFQSLVAGTKEWSGGEHLYESSAPDWSAFRRNAESAVRARLIDPDSARISWPYGFLLGAWRPFLQKRIEGYWTCGLVNARNRMGGYAGTTAFVVVLGPDGHVKYVGLGESKDYDLLTASCSGSAKVLPPPPAQLVGAIEARAESSASSGSIADELKKLVELRDSGAITDEEFQTAKRRLLEAPVE